MGGAYVTPFVSYNYEPEGQGGEGSWNRAAHWLRPVPRGKKD